VVPTPTGDGSITISEGPLIVFVLNPRVPDPVENCAAVIIPIVLTDAVEVSADAIPDVGV